MARRSERIVIGESPVSWQIERKSGVQNNQDGGSPVEVIELTLTEPDGSLQVVAYFDKATWVKMNQTVLGLVVP